MTNFFKDAPVYSICSHSYILNSEDLQTYYFSITMAPMPSAAARAVAKKYLQDIYKQELKDCKQKYTYNVALNQTTLKALTAFIAQAKLAIKKIHQAYFFTIKKNATIINIVKTDFSKSSLPFIIKSLDLLFSKILISKATAI